MVIFLSSLAAWRDSPRYLPTDLPLSHTRSVLRRTAGNVLGRLVVDKILENGEVLVAKQILVSLCFPEQLVRASVRATFSSQRMALLSVTPYLSRKAWSTSV